MGITGINLKLLEQITHLLNKTKTFHYNSQIYFTRPLSNLQNSRLSFI